MNAAMACLAIGAHRFRILLWQAVGLWGCGAKVCGSGLVGMCLYGKQVARGLTQRSNKLARETRGPRGVRWFDSDQLPLRRNNISWSCIQFFISVPEKPRTNVGSCPSIYSLPTISSALFSTQSIPSFQRLDRAASVTAAVDTGSTRSVCVYEREARIGRRPVEFSKNSVFVTLQ